MESAIHRTVPQMSNNHTWLNVSKHNQGKTASVTKSFVSIHKYILKKDIFTLCSLCLCVCVFMRWELIISSEKKNIFRKYFWDFLVIRQPFSSKRLYFIITSHRWVSLIFFTVIKTIKRSGRRARCMISSDTMSWLINCECSLLMLQVIDFRFHSTSSSFYCKSIQFKVWVSADKKRLKFCVLFCAPKGQWHGDLDYS